MTSPALIRGSLAIARSAWHAARRWAARLAPRWCYRRRLVSYSQEREDVLLDVMLDERREGFYIDIGCHHPFRFSNTCHFYQRGWRGIVVDPNPDCIRLFAKFRPRDTAICCGIALQSGEMTYHMFREPALNTFDPDVCRQAVAQGNGPVVRTVPVRVCPFREIQKEHLPAGRHVDLLSVDVEGFDLLVLQSIDWATCMPDFVVVEENTAASGFWDAESEIGRFLQARGYRRRACIRRSAIYWRHAPGARAPHA